MAELVLRLRDREMARIGVVKTSVTLGRDASCDLVIDNAAVSRMHAVVSFGDGDYRVQDNESENGITLNGKRVRKAALSFGDVIGIGKFEIELVDSYHEPMVRADPQLKDSSKNVMKTMQVDSATAARLRDEAMARMAAAKGLPAPAPKSRQRGQSASSSVSRAPGASSQVQPVRPSGAGTLNLILLVAAALIAGAVLTLVLTR